MADNFLKSSLWSSPQLDKELLQHLKSLCCQEGLTVIPIPGKREKAEQEEAAGSKQEPVAKPMQSYVNLVGSTVSVDNETSKCTESETVIGSSNFAAKPGECSPDFIPEGYENLKAQVSNLQQIIRTTNCGKQSFPILPSRYYNEFIQICGLEEVVFSDWVCESNPPYLYNPLKHRRREQPMRCAQCGTDHTPSWIYLEKNGKAICVECSKGNVKKPIQTAYANQMQNSISGIIQGDIPQNTDKSLLSLGAVMFSNPDVVKAAESVVNISEQKTFNGSLEKAIDEFQAEVSKIISKGFGDENLKRFRDMLPLLSMSNTLPNTAPRFPKLALQNADMMNSMNDCLSFMQRILGDTLELQQNTINSLSQQLAEAKKSEDKKLK